MAEIRLQARMSSCRLRRRSAGREGVAAGRSAPASRGGRERSRHRVRHHDGPGNKVLDRSFGTEGSVDEPKPPAGRPCDLRKGIDTVTFQIPEGLNVQDPCIPVARFDREGGLFNNHGIHGTPMYGLRDYSGPLRGIFTPPPSAGGPDRSRCPYRPGGSASSAGRPVSLVSRSSCRRSRRLQFHPPDARFGPCRPRPLPALRGAQHLRPALTGVSKSGCIRATAASSLPAAGPGPSPAGGPRR